MYVSLLSGLFLLRLSIRPRTEWYVPVYWMVLIGLFLFSAFRYEVGCDWYSYARHYQRGSWLQYNEVLTGREPLWWGLQIAVSRLGLPYPAVNVVSSAIFFAGVHVLARRQPDPLGFLVLLFPVLIVNMPMSAVRQGTAIGLLCIALVAFLDRRPIRYVAWVVVASLFHTSAIIFVLLAPLATGAFGWKRLLFAAAPAVPGLIVMLQGSSAQHAVDIYVDSGLEAFGAVFRITLLALSGAGFLLFLRRAWAHQYPGDYGLVIIGSWAMLGLFVLLPISTVMSDRIAYYIIPVQVMILSRIPFLSLDFGRDFISLVPYIGLIVFFIGWTVGSSLFQECYVPYRSWIFGLPDFSGLVY